MTSKLSNLSIAAIALFAASVPCLAQAQSVESRVKESADVVVANSQLAVPFNAPRLADEPSLGMLNVAPKNVVSVSPSETSSKVLPASFMMRMGQLSTVGTPDSFAQQTPIYEMGLGNSEKQFRLDEYNGGDQRRRVTFVPSLGQKLPS